MQTTKTKVRFPVALLAGAWILLALVSTGNAQVVTATLVGTVHDSSGAVVPKVTVTVNNEETNFARTVTTNETGDYTVTALNPGKYTISAELRGFKKAVLSGIMLQVDQKARVDITLATGELSEIITVEGAAAPLIETESPQIGSVIGENRVTGLPLNGRNFMELTTLTGGINEGNSSTAKSISGFAPAAAGMPSTENNYQLDGVDNKEMFYNRFSLAPSVDAILEFRIQVGQYSAEFGAGGGAVINVVTKSGTNAFHGTVFEFLRNDAVDAKNFFAKSLPPLRRNQFGGSAGGPIIKNRTFIFGNYDATRERRGLTFVRVVPTTAQAAGDLSSFSKPITDPSNGQPFAGAVIPGNRIDPISRKLLSYYPALNNGGDPLRNFIDSPSLQNDINSGLMRVDHRLSAKHNLMGRYGVQDIDRYSPDAYALVGGVGTLARYQNLALGVTSTWSPRLLNEFRFGLGRSRYDTKGQNNGKPLAQDLGLAFHGQTDFEKGFVETVAMDRTLISPIGEGSSSFQTTQTFQWYDGLVWVRDKHTFKAGVDLRRIGSDLKFSTNANGAYRFSGQYTGDGFADFLLGFPSTSSVQAAPNTPLSYHRGAIAVYVLDEWKASAKLSLNFGLRYELESPPREEGGNTPIFDPTLGNGTGGLLFPKQNTNAKSFFTQVLPDLPFGYLDRETGNVADTNNFAPRFGFAYRPFGTTRTVVRGGYGWYYSSPQFINLVENAAISPPTNQWATFTANTLVPDLGWNGKIGVSPRDTFKDLRFGILAGLESHWLNAYTQQWSLGVGQELEHNLAVNIEYLGSKSNHVEDSYDYNYAQPAPGSMVAHLPYPKWGRIFGFNSGAAANYNALLVSAEQRFAQGLTFKASYTYGKAETFNGGRSTGGNIGEIQNPANSRAEKGPTIDDITHRFSLNYIYELPAHNVKGVAGKVVNGWSVAGITTFRTGFPLFGPSVSKTNCNSSSDNPCRPDLIRNPLLGGNGVDTPRFDRAAFDWPLNPIHAAQSPRFGNAGPNILRSNRLGNWDLALVRNFRARERFRAEFRFELFNAFNHPNFGNPNVGADNPILGRTSTALEPRDLQFGIKFFW